MSVQSGHIELERTVDSIRIGRRHRADLGDLDDLVASIEREGLLQPITITPDGVLVCGARRLAAIKELGWKSVNVWVRSGISDRLGQLLAEQDENLLHKPLTPLEAAALYRGLKGLVAEDAAGRKAATQFQAGHEPGEHGGANFAPPPASSAAGKSREQAAAMIPGGALHTTHEKINYLQRLAASLDEPADLRELAAEELQRIEDGRPVDPGYRRVRAEAEQRRAVHDEQLHDLAAEALARVKQEIAKKKPRALRPTSVGEPVQYPTRAFVHTWTEMAGWWTHYDVNVLAQELTEEQVETFLDTAEQTARFATQLRQARRRTTEDSAEDQMPVRRLHAL